MAGEVTSERYRLKRHELAEDMGCFPRSGDKTADVRYKKIPAVEQKTTTRTLHSSCTTANGPGTSEMDTTYWHNGRQPRFSLRGYVAAVRQIDIRKCWPFSIKSLLDCLEEGKDPLLPPLCSPKNFYDNVHKDEFGNLSHGKRTSIDETCEGHKLELLLDLRDTAGQKNDISHKWVQKSLQTRVQCDLQFHQGTEDSESGYFRQPELASFQEDIHTTEGISVGKLIASNIQQAPTLVEDTNRKCPSGSDYDVRDASQEPTSEEKKEQILIEYDPLATRLERLQQKGQILNATQTPVGLSNTADNLDDSNRSSQYGLEDQSEVHQQNGVGNKNVKDTFDKEMKLNDIIGKEMKVSLFQVDEHNVSTVLSGMTKGQQCNEVDNVEAQNVHTTQSIDGGSVGDLLKDIHEIDSSSQLLKDEHRQVDKEKMVILEEKDGHKNEAGSEDESADSENSESLKRFAELGSLMAFSEAMVQQKCPVCLTFQSSSNTALNAHIDHCLEVVDKDKAELKYSKSKMRVRKKRSLAELCSITPLCVLKELQVSKDSRKSLKKGVAGQQNRLRRPQSQMVISAAKRRHLMLGSQQHARRYKRKVCNVGRSKEPLALKRKRQRMCLTHDGHAMANESRECTSTEKAFEVALIHSPKPVPLLLVTILPINKKKKKENRDIRKIERNKGVLGEAAHNSHIVI